MYRVKICLGYTGYDGDGFKKDEELPIPVTTIIADPVNISSIADCLSKALMRECNTARNYLKLFPDERYIKIVEEIYSKLRDVAYFLFRLKEISIILFDNRDNIKSHWLEKKTIENICAALEIFWKWQMDFNELVIHQDSSYWKDWKEDNEKFLVSFSLWKICQQT